MTITCYWKLLGGHVHMRFFINGAGLGNLCCREEEFSSLCSAMQGVVFSEERG